MKIIHGKDTGQYMTEDVIRVAVLEPRPEKANQVLSLAAASKRIDACVLPNAAAYAQFYGGRPRPDVLLVGLDGNADAALSATRELIARMPACGVIVYGTGGMVELLPRAMEVGARRYLSVPFDAPSLLTAVVEVCDGMKALVESSRNGATVDDEDQQVPAVKQASKVVSVFSPKGGVGTSTLAVNLACALGQLGRRVVIVDGNMSFGNIGVFFDIAPVKSMLNLIDDPDGIRPASVDEVLMAHESGVQVLLAPPNPEEADGVTADHLRRILGVLRTQYDYVVVDTWPSYDDRVLAMLETSDQILVLTAPEIQSIKNLTGFLRVAGLLQFPETKLIPVLMRADSVMSEYLQQIEGFLKQPLVWRIVSDGKRATQSVIKGTPFVLSDPKAPVSQNIFALARMLDGQDEVLPAAPPALRKRSMFGLGKTG